MKENLWHRAHRHPKPVRGKTPVRLCLWVLGILAGAAVPRSRRRQFAVGAVATFIAIYLPLIAGYLHRVVQTRREEALAALDPDPADTPE